MRTTAPGATATRPPGSRATCVMPEMSSISRSTGWLKSPTQLPPRGPAAELVASVPRSQRELRIEHADVAAGEIRPAEQRRELGRDQQIGVGQRELAVGEQRMRLVDEEPEAAARVAQLECVSDPRWRSGGSR